MGEPLLAKHPFKFCLISKASYLCFLGFDSRYLRHSMGALSKGLRYEVNSLI